MDALAATVAWFERNGRAGDPAHWPTYDGEFFGLCPFHDDQRTGSFSFSTRGYKCFACDAHGGLFHLAVLTAQDFDKEKPVYSVSKAPTPPIWKEWDIRHLYGDLPPQALDYYRRRGFTPRTIREYGLGWGVLPQCACHHERLILPVYDAEGDLVALKGRSYACDCEKWTQAKGSRPALFNAGLLRYARGRCVIVTEAPYSAMLAMQDDLGLTVVASSCGVNTWLPEWTTLLVEAHPIHVCVWFDNDEVGAGWADWLAQELAQAGLSTSCFIWEPDWPEKADLADYRKGNSVRLGLFGARRTQVKLGCNPRPSFAKATPGVLLGRRTTYA